MQILKGLFLLLKEWLWAFVEEVATKCAGLACKRLLGSDVCDGISVCDLLYDKQSCRTLTLCESVLGVGNCWWF